MSESDNTFVHAGLVLIPVLELPRMLEEGSLAVPLAHTLAFVASGCLGFCVNFSSFFVMQTSSALVLKLLGTLRNVSLIGFSIFFYSEDVSIAQASRCRVTPTSPLTNFTAMTPVKQSSRYHATATN